jgi:predicted RNA-binding Zn-ribbon protein involved in translation (DUF1610 family)
MKLFNRIREAIISKREGFVKVYCPCCGRHFATMRPETTLGKFWCPCGAAWETRLIYEKIDK